MDEKLIVFLIIAVTVIFRALEKKAFGHKEPDATESTSPFDEESNPFPMFPDFMTKEQEGNTREGANMPPPYTSPVEESYKQKHTELSRDFSFEGSVAMPSINTAPEVNKYASALEKYSNMSVSEANDDMSAMDSDGNMKIVRLCQKNGASSIKNKHKADFDVAKAIVYSAILEPKFKENF